MRMKFERRDHRQDGDALIAEEQCCSIEEIFLSISGREMKILRPSD